MKLSKFKYDLDEKKIALHPAGNRDESKLMVLHKETQTIEHKSFKDIIDYFEDKDVFVFNDTKVFPARLYGNKEKTGAEIMSTIKKLPKYFNATLKDPIDLSLPDPGDDDDLQPLYIVISARPYSISYDSRHWDFTYSLPSTIKGNNLLIIYPQQFE